MRFLIPIVAALLGKNQFFKKTITKHFWKPGMKSGFYQGQETDNPNNTRQVQPFLPTGGAHQCTKNHQSQLSITMLTKHTIMQISL
mmetsp:Transcript_1101/g.1282  ORF Transcript_1101/g.1282 Transcript_1101/m.1282 type:complete len:86 (+) Transcript_1101:106-363(+)